MRRRYVHLLIPVVLWLSPPVSTSAKSLAPQSTPEISVFVYGFPGLSDWLVQGAESEASRIFQPARIQLKWINCPSEALTPPLCHGRQARGELAVLFSAKAPSSVSPNALGAAVFSPVEDTALVFYDRISQSPISSTLHTMLGRVLAHEIAHLLLHGEKHSWSGLMRPKWAWDDLRFASTACIGFDPESVRRMQQEVRRRAVAESERTGK